MPLFHMVCQKCAHDEEHLIMTTDGPPKRCPACKSTKYQQVWHPPTVVTNYSPMHPRANRGSVTQPKKAVAKRKKSSYR